MSRHVLLLLSFFLLTACNDAYTWRQKLTVVLHTTDGEITASTVTEVTKIRSDSFWMPIEARGVRSHIRGEALTVEVTPDRYFFVLLDGQDQLALRAFPQLASRMSDEFPQWAQAIQKQRDGGVVPPEYYPTIVTFDDLNDPMTIRRLSIGALPQAFGPEIHIRSLILEITEEPLTIGVLEQILPWLGSLEEFEEVPGNPFTSQLPSLIRHFRSD